MKRLRMAAFTAVAGLAFVPGCCCFDGQLLNRMFYPRQSSGCCECSTCGSTPLGGEGPMLGDPNSIYMNQPPPIQEQPGPKLVPQAQPLPASPVSTTKK